MSGEGKKHLSQFDLMLVQLQRNIFADFLGPKTIASRYIINGFKGLTFLWVVFLMNKFNNHSTGMYLYLFLHGSYGLFWIVKDLIFPDPRFQQRASVGSFIMIFFFLALYWLIPVPLAAGQGIDSPSTPRIILLVLMYIGGLILMLGSDYQKYVALKSKPGLISDGFFKNTRNPNYLGEILIYSSFVHCSGHFLGCIIFYGVACVVFAMNIYVKDKTSLSLKKGWETYSQNSYVLLPKLFATFYLNFAFYSVVLLLLVSFLWLQTPQGFFNFDFEGAVAARLA